MYYRKGFKDAKGGSGSQEEDVRIIPVVLVQPRLLTHLGVLVSRRWVAGAETPARLQHSCPAPCAQFDCAVCAGAHATVMKRCCILHPSTDVQRPQGAILLSVAQ